MIATSLSEMKKFAAVAVFLIASVLAVPVPDESADRIVGGNLAGIGQFPHQVSLRDRNNRHFCGGSIIDPNWALTAAHCLANQHSSNVLVVVGTNSLNSGGLAYSASYLYVHQGYSPSNHQHDIALIAVTPSIQFNNLIQPIPLNTAGVPGNVPLILSGWGLTSYPSNQIPNDLQYVTLTSLTFEQCIAALPEYPIYNTHVCTAAPVGQGACQGDSGGPLIYNGIQVGVVSWGIPCAVGDPDIFTSVAHYRSWITSISGV